MINEQTGGGSRGSLEASLRKAGRSESEYRAELKPSAVQRIERSLVLTRLAEQEGLTVDQAEVEADLDRMAGPATPQNQRMREMFDSPTGREFIERTLLTRRVYGRLRDITEGKEVPPQAAVDEALPAEAQSKAAETTATPESERDVPGEAHEPATKGRDSGSEEGDKLSSGDIVEAARADA